MTQTGIDLTNNEMKLGSDIAHQFLAPYLAAWIEATLRQPHSLPSLIEHKRKILLDLITMREGHGRP